jgi:hypothetical protein
MLKPDGTLELGAKPSLPAGPVRVTVESLSEPAQPERFWAMMQSIWSDLRASGHVPRSREQIDAELNALRDEAEEEMKAIERLHEESRGPPTTPPR